MSSVILGAARTPFTKVGGSLASVPAVSLGQAAARAALERAGVAAEQIEYVIFGQVIQAGAGHIPSRQVSLGVGIPEHVGSDTINKVCASGLRAVALADQAIRAGDRRLILAGGMESMSNAPYLLRKARFGYRFGDDTLIDSMVQDGLRDPWSGKQMYEQASEIADELGIHRSDLDGWALRSHERAVAAIDAGRFAEEIVPVEVTSAARPRSSRSTRGLAATPRWRPGGATATGRRASDAHRGQLAGVTDGAGALVVADEEWASAEGLTPLARIRGVGSTANRHDSLARVPALAARLALEHAGVEIDAVDRFEINEAFASVAFQSSRDLGIDTERVNVDGGAVALGHPVGASAHACSYARAAAARAGRRHRRRGDLLGWRTGRRDGARGARARVIDPILVVGAGQMGGGIAQVAATAGLHVTLVDVDEPSLERDSRASGGRSTACGRRERSDPDAVLARISTSTELASGRDCGLMIEAAPERFELKAELFARADELLGPEAILATNTSSIPIGRLAACTNRPDRVCGMHS